MSLNQYPMWLFPLLDDDEDIHHDDAAAPSSPPYGVASYYLLFIAFGLCAVIILVGVLWPSLRKLMHRIKSYYARRDAPLPQVVPPPAPYPVPRPYFPPPPPPAAVMEIVVRPREPVMLETIVTVARDSPVACALCSVEFREGEVVLSRPRCRKHVYHDACIRQRLVSGSDCCPACDTDGRNG